MFLLCAVQPQEVVCRESADRNGAPGDDLGLMTIGQCCLDTPNGLGFYKGEVCSPCIGEYHGRNYHRGRGGNCLLPLAGCSHAPYARVLLVA